MDHSAIALQVATEAAQIGASVTSRYFERLSSTDVELKHSGSGGANIVTTADVESEQAIVAAISKHFPDHEFLGEEGHAADTSAPHLWIIDPLDGTNNFAHGIPQFAVSVAYYQNGKGICGVVINPVSGDLYTASVGGGAFRNGEPANVNSHQSLSDTMLATGFYYDRGAMMRSTLGAIDSLFGKGIHGIRRFGAAALDLCAVGAGQYGGFFEFTLSPWDYAAAAIFIREAGGKITNCAGSELSLLKTSVLATNGALHEAMLDTIKPHLQGQNSVFKLEPGASE